MKYLLLIILAILLNACGSAMVLKTERVEPDGTKVKVTLKSDREYANFDLLYDPETKKLEIHASEVKTGPDAWAPIVGKLVDKLPVIPVVPN